MEPWNADGSGFNDNFLQTFTPVSNEQVRLFLAPGNNRRTVIVAPKGYGKTLLLKKKAADTRHLPSSESLYIHPTNAADSVEYLRIDSLGKKVTDWEWLKKVDNQQEWSNLWCYAIGFLVCYNEGKQIGATATAKDVLGELSALFGLSRAADQKYSVSSFLTMMLEDWDNGASRFSKFYAQQARPLLDALSRLHILFLDSPDEALNFDKSDVYSGSDDTGLWGEMPEQWTHFQMGLAYAIRRIRQSHKNVRVFATLRTEAFNGARTELRQQLREYCVELDYSKSDLHEIFKQNIEQMAHSSTFREKLAQYPLAANLMSSFVGIERAWHFPTNREEDLFDAIYRHTRGSPRDIVVMGGLICKIDVDVRRSMTPKSCDQLRAVIDAGGKSFFENQKVAAIPRWHSKLDAILLNFRTNVIHRRALREVSSMASRQSDAGCPFDFLYSQGLVGWVGSSNVGGKALSKFLTGSELSSRDRMLPESPWYVLHPVVYPWLRERHGDGLTIPGGYLSSNRAIVGSGLEMEYPAAIDAAVNASGATLTITGARSLRIPVKCAASAFFLCLVNAIAKENLSEIDLTAFESSRVDIELVWKGAQIQGQTWAEIGGTLRSTFDKYHALTNTSNEWLRLAFGVSAAVSDSAPEPQMRQKRIASGPVAFQRQSDPALVRMVGILPSDVRIIKAA